MNRREFVAASAAMLAAPNLLAQLAGDRPKQTPGVKVLNPHGRVPVSLIIDDSTCLVNLAHFCIPQFAEVFPDRYMQPWKTLPREIPDAFVRKFGEWCHEHGVKGKYSVIPYPACVGWLDRELPGWSKKELQESIKLVQTLLTPDWDFHPEMVTHTWIINTKTGRPYDERTDRFMENWRWTDGRSADEIADYLTYALRILHNIGIPCEGITTPGGFGNRALPALSQASLQSCRDIFKAEIPHYFRHLYTDERSVAPRVEYASGLDGSDPQCVVSIIGCTGDWFGGWDGLEAGSVDQFITEDLKSGRMVEVIKRGEPAVMVCHWPGIYFDGQEVGFNIFKEIVARLEAAYKGKLIWMKLSEIARYWAAKELTRIETVDGKIQLHAPFACPAFTLQVPDANRKVTHNGTPLQLHEASGNTICFDLPKGLTEIS
ncbi:MAG TPA: hypothetical protein VFC26_07705 [Verrucomicrobiae bacterium]|nr:hypothetical protein [Verrucomicrobiae bacterium]